MASCKAASRLRSGDRQPLLAVSSRLLCRSQSHIPPFSLTTLPPPLTDRLLTRLHVACWTLKGVCGGGASKAAHSFSQVEPPRCHVETQRGVRVVMGDGCMLETCIPRRCRHPATPNRHPNFKAARPPPFYLHAFLPFNLVGLGYEFKVYTCFQTYSILPKFGNFN